MAKRGRNETKKPTETAKPRRGRKEKLKVEEVIAALRKSRGIQRYAAQLLHCHRGTVAKMILRYPEIRAVLDEERESLIDTAEGKLAEAIARGEFPAIRFYLACQAKHRGYVERSEVTGAGGKPVVSRADLSRLTEEELHTLFLLTAKAEGLPDEEARKELEEMK